VNGGVNRDALVVCAGCGIELAPGMLACPACRKLVHGARLTQLADEAEAAERDGRVVDALAAWRTARDLLPPGTTQQKAIHDRIARLSLTVDEGAASPGAAKGGTGGTGGKAAGLGALGALAWKLKFVVLAVLAKGKLLVTGLASLPTLLSMVAWVGLSGGRGAAGLAFMGGLVASIYVHEMGHVAALRAYGISATAPMFVPGLGAFVRLNQYPVDAREDARVGLAGPVWGCVAAMGAAAIGLALGSRTALAVASLGATINLFNLVPFWQLDGSRGFRALDRTQRGIVVALAALAALVFDQKMAWVVCAVGGIRLLQDLPPQGDARAFRTFVGLVLALAALARLADWRLAAFAS
jgi:Zn-dependent protease